MKQGTVNLSVDLGPMNTVRARLSKRQPVTNASKAEEDSAKEIPYIVQILFNLNSNLLN